MPTAFIPFCSLGDNMEIVGKTVDNFSLPVCTKFKPKLLKGQLCYNFDLEDIKGIRQGRSGGLKFLMDYNEDRMVRKIERTDSQIFVEGLSQLGGKSLGKNHGAKIYFDLLEPFERVGSGDYVITTVKEIVGTNQYLKWADGSSCQNRETISECESHSFIKNAKECGCRPFALDTVMEDKVMHTIFIKM